MPRKPKTGLEFYSVDTNVFQNRKIKRLIRNYGAKGYLIYSYILTEVYRDKGYFIEWDLNTAFDVSDSVNLKETLVNEVVNYCCNMSLFNKELFVSENVLTTKNIQEFWLDVSRKAKRKNSTVLDKYNLSTNENSQKKEFSTLKRESITLKQEFIPVKQEISTQSKVKESKVNNSYREIEFISDWKTLREDMLKKPTNIPRLSPRESVAFSQASKNIKQEDFIKAIKALFKQEVIKFSSMQSRPQHLLEHIETYITAYNERDSKLYGSKPKTVTL